MYFRLTKLTEDIFELQVNDEIITSSMLLSEQDLCMLEEVLEASSTLGLSQSTDRWYND
jgi:hypothetical protein